MKAGKVSEHQKKMTVQGLARTELDFTLLHSRVKMRRIISHNVGESSYAVERKETLMIPGGSTV